MIFSFIYIYNIHEGKDLNVPINSCFNFNVDNKKNHRN